MTNNDANPDDARAMWIMFQGREWVVMWNGKHYTAFAGDNRRVTPKQLDKLFYYLKSEGFIENQEPNNQHHDNRKDRR